MRHLNDLGLEKRAEKSGTNALGEAMRSHLRRVYNVVEFVDQEDEEGGH